MMACDRLLIKASGRRCAKTLSLVLVSFLSMLALCGLRSHSRQLMKKVAAVYSSCALHWRVWLSRKMTVNQTSGNVSDQFMLGHGLGVLGARLDVKHMIWVQFCLV